ncbi:MAG: DUF59 domain-containing protein [Thermomicrobiaceae bacterium]|nr:DUF59 domain-containing protein [Thermomicrobiaceae bacterium]
MAEEAVQAVWREIASTVRDPAVNRAIGDLGIVRSVRLDGDTLSVRLRPCTPECWPLAMAGIVRSIRAYAAERGWEADVEVEPSMLVPPEAFAAVVGDVARDPGRLRELWERSYTVSLQAVVMALQVAGFDEARLAAMGVGEAYDALPDRSSLDALMDWRRRLGLPDD